MSERPADEHLASVYDELRRLAAAQVANENPGQTLDATALVHEAWFRLGAERSFTSRSHFVRAAAQAMRRILVDRARERKASKRGGDRRRIAFDLNEAAALEPDSELDELDDALTRLAAVQPQKAELVELRYFAGLTLAEAANVLGVSAATADRWWAYAKAWLFAEIRGTE